MASKASLPHLALFLMLNLLFFTLVSATCTCPSPPEPYPNPNPNPYPSPNPIPSPYQYPNPNPYPSPNPIPSPYQYPNPNPYPSPNPNPNPPPAPTYPSIDPEKCPKDAIKIGICAKLLNNDLLKVILGKPPVTPCCTLIEGLADLEAAVCLCTALKASVLGIHLNEIPISLGLLLNNCGGKVPPGFQCP